MERRFLLLLLLPPSSFSGDDSCESCCHRFLPPFTPLDRMTWEVCYPHYKLESGPSDDNHVPSSTLLQYLGVVPVRTSTIHTTLTLSRSVRFKITILRITEGVPLQCSRCISLPFGFHILTNEGQISMVNRFKLSVLFFIHVYSLGTLHFSTNMATISSHYKFETEDFKTTRVRQGVIHCTSTSSTLLLSRPPVYVGFRDKTSTPKTVNDLTSFSCT